ncbi:hypothetical protein HGRIS_007575 [Hohenbuehelia grisea]|uniref:Choline kinase n=1 Tax=Hohenbuehelia grisea TaxID=104357 RepID=A0ABR3J5M8_9AGAR
MSTPLITKAKPRYRSFSQLFRSSIPAIMPARASPIIAPSLTISTSRSIPIPQRQLSTSSVASYAEPVSSAASSSSILFNDDDVEVVTEEGLHHSETKLEARRYKRPEFAVDLLQVLQDLEIPSWVRPDITPESLQVKKVAGSMTNAVFFISHPNARTLLLRIYGSSSGSLISRPRELHTLHILSSQYRIGPRVYGTFENGRVEEYFESTTLTAEDLREPTISQWTGARMAELHSVDIEVVEDTTPSKRGEGKGWEIGAKKNVKSWLSPAREVLALPGVSDEDRKVLDIDDFESQWTRYLKWLSGIDDVNTGSKRVFAHNDTQYGNLLRLAKLKEGVPEHRQIIVVDFEYASPNPASFDIANHFHEWTAAYDSATPHLLDPARYPTPAQRQNFYAAYLAHAARLGAPLIADRKHELALLERQVCAWSPASHAMWAVWGIVQARENVESETKEPEFDYIGYAKCRMEGFRRELAALGVL